MTGSVGTRRAVQSKKSRTCPSTSNPPRAITNVGSAHVSNAGANMAQNAGQTIIADASSENVRRPVLTANAAIARCLAFEGVASPLMTGSATVCQAGNTCCIRRSCPAIHRQGARLATDDLVSIPGEFSKGTVLHVYDEQGNEFARA